MVYEGKRRTRTASGGRRRGRGQGTAAKGPGLLSVCLWLLFLAAAVRIFLPETAERIGARARELTGVDLGGAVQAFGEAMDSGGGLGGAFRDAFDRAFRAQEDAYPAMSGGDGVDSEAGDGGTPGPVEEFLESQREYLGYGVPENVTFEMPEVGIVLMPPLSGTLTSGFGYRRDPATGLVRFHYGADIASAEGTPVTALAAGVVSAVGDSSGYGTYVIVTHDGGVESLYAHLSDAGVTGGTPVQAGDTLGHVGSTGNATGPCLHLEVIVDGNYVNPQYYVNIEE